MGLKVELFPAWCKLTREWCADAGFHTVRIWRAPFMSKKYVTFMKTCGFDGVLGEQGSIQAGFPPKIDTHGVLSEEELYQQFTAVKPNARAPVFASFTPIVEGFTKDGMNAYPKVKRQMDRLETAFPGRYVFLLPKDQFATIRAYYNLPASPRLGLKPNNGTQFLSHTRVSIPLTISPDSSSTPRRSQCDQVGQLPHRPPSPGRHTGVCRWPR